MEHSVDSSGVAARNSVEQEETSTLLATESRPTEWTDEKHSLFIESMEATFVNQLYKSLDSFDSHTNKQCPSGSKSSKHKQTSTRAASGEVFRDGRLSKIDFRRHKPEVDQGEKPGVLLSNPRIKHFRCSRRQAIRKFPASRTKAPLVTNENQYPAHNFQLWREDSAGSNTEVTGQNFNDDLEEERSSRILRIKRTRTSTDTVSCNDQVVPFNNCCSGG